jgi:hypothetical protein
MTEPAAETVVIVDGMWPPQQKGLYPGNAAYLTPGGTRVGETIVHVGTATLRELKVGDVLERDGEKILIKSLEPTDEYGHYDAHGRIEVVRGYQATQIRQHPMQSSWVRHPFRV